MSGSLAWPVLLGLGALHGLNPGMGWLFPVALAGLAGLVIPPDALRWIVASLLLALGASRLVRARHPRWGGMRVGPRTSPSGRS